MELTLALFLLIIGFVFLVVGADKFVEGASAIACKLGIPPLLVGLTIVAFGTSAPELTVSITAGLQGANEIVISNVLGSNIFNLLMVIGISSLICPLVIEKEVLNREWVYSIVASLVLLVALLDGEISRIDGVILLVGLTFVMTTQIKDALSSRKVSKSDESDDIIIEDASSDSEVSDLSIDETTKTQEEIQEETQEEEEEIEGINPNLTNKFMIMLYVLGGLGAIIFGGDLVVDSATTIARVFGVSETLIGLTIVAIGTSLPELVTAIVGVKRGENDIVVGNAIGSNLFNVLLILGVSTTINPIPVVATVIGDAIFLILISIVMLLLAKKNGDVKRNIGSVMVLLYVLYTVYIIVRQ